MESNNKSAKKIKNIEGEWKDAFYIAMSERCLYFKVIYETEPKYCDGKTHVKI